jgi:hypothetical protein
MNIPVIQDATKLLADLAVLEIEDASGGYDFAAPSG